MAFGVLGLVTVDDGFTVETLEIPWLNNCLGMQGNRFSGPGGLFYSYVPIGLT